MVTAFQRSHPLQTITLGLGFQHINLGSTTTILFRSCPWITSSPRTSRPGCFFWLRSGRAQWIPTGCPGVPALPFVSREKVEKCIHLLNFISSTGMRKLAATWGWAKAKCPRGHCHVCGVHSVKKALMDICCVLATSHCSRADSCQIL